MKIVCQMAISLDGFIASKDGGTIESKQLHDGIVQNHYRVIDS